LNKGGRSRTKGKERVRRAEDFGNVSETADDSVKGINVVGVFRQRVEGKDDKDDGTVGR
jgi:hypothetical protein